MELDELKESWKNIGRDKQPLTDDGIKKLMRHSSNSPLVKLRKSMLIELSFFVAGIIVMYLMYFSNSFNSNPIVLYGLGMLTAIMVMFGYTFYSRIYDRTKKMTLTRSVAEELRQNIDLLKSDMNLYVVMYLLMFVPSILVAIMLSNLNLESLDQLLTLNINFWIIITIVSILIFPLYYLFVKWWINRFYGRFVEELEEMYSELDRAENDEF